MKLHCIEPGAVQDWELEACVNDKATPHVMKHLEHCPACRTRLSEYVQFERRLRQILYRFDCPSPDMLRDYYWGYLPADERRRVEAHLDSCPHCTAELADLAGFVAAERTQPLNTLLNQARQAAAQARLVVAQIVSPGLQPVPALRGETREVLFFEAKDVALTVNLEQENAGAYTLFGQILSPEPIVFAGGYARLTDYEGNIAPVQAVLDANGGFTLPDLRSGIYQLVVSLPDQRIVIPTLALKVEM